MPNHKLVSVIIPTYNNAKFINEAINSVLKQTYKNFEIIVVDDGSTDNTKRILESYIKGNEIKYIYQENKGTSSAKNAGIKNSRGEYIKFLDSDDLLLPECLKLQIDFLERNKNFDIVYSNFYYFDNTGQKFVFANHLKNADKIRPTGDLLPYLLYGNFIAINTLLFKKEVMDKVGFFNEELSHHEDLEYLLRIAIKKIKFGYIHQFLASCYLRSDSLSTNKIKMAETLFQIFQFINNNLDNDLKRKFEVNKKLILYEYAYGVCLLRNNQSEKGRKILKSTILKKDLPITQKIIGVIRIISSYFSLFNFLLIKFEKIFEKSNYIKLNIKLRQ